MRLAYEPAARPAITEIIIAAYATGMQTRPLMQLECKRGQVIQNSKSPPTQVTGKHGRLFDQDANATAYATRMQTRPPLQPGCKRGCLYNPDAI